MIQRRREEVLSLVLECCSGDLRDSDSPGTSPRSTLRRTLGESRNRPSCATKISTVKDTRDGVIEEAFISSDNLNNRSIRLSNKLEDED